MNLLANGAGRRDAFRSLGAVGMALLAAPNQASAAGAGAVQAERRKRRKKRRKPRGGAPTGSAGSAWGSGAQADAVPGLDLFSSAAYTDPVLHPGPTVTVDVPASGRVLVTVTATIEPWAVGDIGFMSFASSGGSGVDVEASSQRALIYHREVDGGFKPFRASATHVVTVGSNTTKTFTAKYRTGGGGGGTAAFYDREIIAIPLP
jgi:hypothetical protein